MYIKRINCYLATCEKCKNHIFVKRRIWDDKKLYTCQYYPKLHKSISGEDCGHFRCNNYGRRYTCDDCTGGEDIKTYKRKRS